VIFDWPGSEVGAGIFFDSGSLRNTAEYCGSTSTDSGSGSDTWVGAEVGGRLNGDSDGRPGERLELRIWNCHEPPFSPGVPKGATVLHGPSLLIEIEF